MTGCACACACDDEEGVAYSCGERGNARQRSLVGAAGTVLAVPPRGLFNLLSMYVLDYVGTARGHIICQIAPETLPGCPKFQYFTGEAWPQPPLVAALRAHAPVGLTTTKLLAPALFGRARQGQG